VTPAAYVLFYQRRGASAADGFGAAPLLPAWSPDAQASALHAALFGGADGAAAPAEARADCGCGAAAGGGGDDVVMAPLVLAPVADSVIAVAESSPAEAPVAAVEAEPPVTALGAPSAECAPPAHVCQE
jgi:hypothetical protein